MRLAFGAGVGDQGVGLEPLGLLEHGAGDIDRIVKGKFMDDIDRGPVEAGQPPKTSGNSSVPPSGQPPCELRAGRDFDLVR